MNCAKDAKDAKFPQRIVSFKMRAKLTAEDALDIFRFKESMISASKLSKKYGVTEKAVRDIWTGRTWLRETSCLDASRSLQPKKMGRPLGRKDAKPRKQRIARLTSPLPQVSYKTTDGFTLYRSEVERHCSHQIFQAWPNFEGEAAYGFLLFPWCSKAVEASNKNIAGRDKSIDELLYENDLRTEIDREFQDPFGQDWFVEPNSIESKAPGQ